MFGTLFGAHGDLLSRSARVRRRNRIATPIAGEVLEQRVLLSLDSVGVDLRDFNGDGIEDVIEMQQDGEWWVGLSNGANSFATSIWADWASIVLCRSPGATRSRICLAVAMQFRASSKRPCWR